MKWQDPAPEAGKPFGKVLKYSAEAARLRANPGRWALIAEDLTKEQGYAMAANVKRGFLAAFKPAGSFEAVSAKGSVWVRYVGEE